MKQRYGLLDKEPPYQDLTKSLKTDITNLLLPALFAEHEELFVDREDARDILFAFTKSAESAAALIDEKAKAASLAKSMPKGPKGKRKLGDGQAVAALEDKPSDKPDFPETEEDKGCHPDSAELGDLDRLDQNTKDAKIEEILLADMQHDEPPVEKLCRLGRLHSLFREYEEGIKLDADDDWVFGHLDGDALEDIQGLIDFIKNKRKDGDCGGGSADASTKMTETLQDLPTEHSTKPVKQEQTQVCGPAAPSASVAAIEIADSDAEDPTATATPTPGPAETQQVDVTNAQETAQPEHVQATAQSAEAEPARELEFADAEKALCDLQMRGVASAKLLEQDHHHGQRADKLRAQTEEVVAAAQEPSETRVDAAAAPVAAGESAFIDDDDDDKSEEDANASADDDYHDKVGGRWSGWFGLV